MLNRHQCPTGANFFLLLLFITIPLWRIGAENLVYPTAIAPQKWQVASQELLPPSVIWMVVNPSQSPFPPSINISREIYQGSFEEYLNLIKQKNQLDHYQQKIIGKINTHLGIGTLLQVDIPSQWGKIRMLHAFIPSNGEIYIITAAALLKEFSQYYEEFFETIQSFGTPKKSE